MRRASTVATRHTRSHSMSRASDFLRRMRLSERVYTRRAESPSPNDGILLDTMAMRYWTGEDIPFYYALANTFPLADRWFSSCLAETYPNRRFLMAGTAAGIVSTSVESLTA